MILPLALFSGAAVLSAFLSGCEVYPEETPKSTDLCPAQPKPGIFDKIFGTKPRVVSPVLRRSPTCPSGELLPGIDGTSFLAARPSSQDLNRLKQLIVSSTNRIESSDPNLKKLMHSALLMPDVTLDEIQDLAKKLNAPENAGKKVTIVGHSRVSQGSDEASKSLSENRAELIALLLKGFGVEASRISYKGLGKDCPVAIECGTPEEINAAMVKNNRVEILLN